MEDASHRSGTVSDCCAENVNCISEGGTEPDARDVERLHRWPLNPAEEGSRILGSFEKRRSRCTITRMDLPTLKETLTVEGKAS